MKKLITTVALAALTLAALLGFSACSGGGETPLSEKAATARAYGLVHSYGQYLGAATATVDAQGAVKFIEINEYMLPDGALAYNTSGAKVAINYADSIAIGTKTYPKYFQIGAKYFETTNVSSKAVFKEIAGGTIADLTVYLAPAATTDTAAARRTAMDATINSAASKWYGEAIEDNKFIVLRVVNRGDTSADVQKYTQDDVDNGVPGAVKDAPKKDGDGNNLLTTSVQNNMVKIKDAANADVELIYEMRPVGGSGGINKAFSNYGSVGYNWVANQKALEKYFYENGFNFANTDVVLSTTSKTWSIKDVTTTATETDALDYLNVMKKACETAYNAAK